MGPHWPFEKPSPKSMLIHFTVAYTITNDMQYDMTCNTTIIQNTLRFIYEGKPEAIFLVFLVFTLQVSVSSSVDVINSQWRNLERYGWNLWLQNHMKHSKAQTLYIFLEIYCLVCLCFVVCFIIWDQQIDGLVQERCNSIANALEFCLSCTNPSKMVLHYVITMSALFFDNLSFLFGWCVHG